MSRGSSLWGWHGGDCAWARGRGVWRQGGAWVCGEKKVASAEVSRREGPDSGHQTHSRAWHAMDGDERVPPTDSFLFPAPSPATRWENCCAPNCPPDPPQGILYMGHLSAMGTSKRHANKELIFQFTAAMLCHRTPPGPTSGRPQRHPRGQLPGWGVAGGSQRPFPPVFSFYQSVQNKGPGSPGRSPVAEPSPTCPPWTPPSPMPLRGPSHLAAGWQWAAGCPERLPQWQGSGLRRIRAPAREAKMAWWWSPAG